MSLKFYLHFEYRTYFSTKWVTDGLRTARELPANHFWISTQDLFWQTKPFVFVKKLTSLGLKKQVYKLSFWCSKYGTHSRTKPWKDSLQTVWYELQRWVLSFTCLDERLNNDKECFSTSYSKYYSTFEATITTNISFDTMKESHLFSLWLPLISFNSSVGGF